MPKGKKNKQKNKTISYLKEELQKRFSEIAEADKLNHENLVSLKNKYFADVQIQLESNKSVRTFSLDVIKQKYGSAFPHGYGKYISAYNKAGLEQLLEKTLINEIKAILDKRIEPLEDTSQHKSLKSLTDPLLIGNKEYTVEEAIEKAGLTNDLKENLAQQIDDAKKKEIVEEMTRRLISLNTEGLVTLRQRQMTLSLSIKLSNGHEVSLDDGKFVDKKLQERYREEQRRVTGKIASLESFDRAITEILGSFKQKINEIGTHKPEVKTEAEGLYDSLIRMKVKVLAGKLSLDEFKTNSKDKINEAIPKFQDDLDWITYLKNMAKQLWNSTIKCLTAGRFNQGFFDIKKSLAHAGASAMSEKIDKLEVSDNKDDELPLKL